jgi:hypothetical protein
VTSLGFIIGSIIAGLLIVIGIVGLFVGSALRRRGDRDYGEGAMVLGFSIALLVITCGATAFIDYPYDMQYHRYVHVEGTIDVIEARMLADGDGGTSQNYAVRFKESGDTYRCDDSRCTPLKSGDWLSLWCIREWQYASTPGWVCNFDRSKQATS